MSEDFTIAANSSASGDEERARLGDRLRALRKARSMTLAEVSLRSGISVATLSKVERGLSALGYDRFSQLAAGLKVDMAELLSERRGVEPGLVVSAGAGRAVKHRTGNAEVSMLFTDVWGKAMVPLLATIRPDERIALQDWFRHPGQEFLHVLSGRLRLMFEGRAPVTLEAGESAYFDSARGHLYAAPDDRPASVLIVCVSPEREAAVDPADGGV